MPTITCLRCNRLTNTATSDHLNAPEGKADRCYAAHVNDKWVPGCAVNDTDELAKMEMKLVKYLFEKGY